MKTELLDRLTNLPDWNRVAETLGFCYLSTPSYMVGVSWDSLKSCNNVNGMHFYNTREGLTNVDFLTVDNNTGTCVKIVSHYNLQDRHIIEHIDSVLSTKEIS